MSGASQAAATAGGSARDMFCNSVAGAAAGVFVAPFVHPLDVVKTRLQVDGVPSGHKGSVIIPSLQTIIKKEGLKGLYRGLSPTILALIPNWAVYFMVYERLKGLVHSHVDDGNQVSTSTNMIAAVGAGAAQAITTNPLWVVRTRLQTQGIRPEVDPYGSVPSALRRIACEEGLRGLYRGTLPSLVGVSHVAIQIPAYEMIKHSIARKDNKTVDQPGHLNVIFATVVSKVAASIVTYPHEVVRSKLQEQGQGGKVRYAGVIDCVQKVNRHEGIPGFYRGFFTSLLRTIPSAVITFASYESIRGFFLRALPPDEKLSQFHLPPGTPKELKSEMLIYIQFYFAVYERLEGLVHSRVDNGNQVSPGTNMIAAVGAGAAQAITANPLRVARTGLQVVCSRLQEQGHGRISEVLFVGVNDCVKKVFQDFIEAVIQIY